MTKEEFLEKLTQMARQLKKDASTAEKKLWLETCDRIANASGWNKDAKGAPDQIILNFPIDPNIKVKEELTEAANNIEKLPEQLNSDVLDIKLNSSV